MTDSDIDTDTDHPWEPPLAGTEVEHLVGALERMRTTFRWKPTISTPPGCASVSAPRRSPSAAC